ncbi:MAG TPA: heme ABC exporter ATP-binding protein CcmA [Roseiarcus sp.]|jgi:heme exporter protein A|nr:heme ABC exporter ATP-binding protein CcmA [Roseiarcus sp.]
MRFRAENIGVDRGGRRLFSDLSFEVKSGEALIVLGPNGAGKTSLLRAIAGLLALAAGALSADGDDDDEATLGEQAHYLGHADALKSALTAGENLEFWAEMLASPPRADRLSRQREQAPAARRPMTALAALDRLGLGHVLDFPVHALSAGQKRRVALARLLAADRPLWLLDEPLTALDQAAQARFTEIMRQHLAAGGLIVAATHAPLALDGARELRLGAALVSP